MLFKVDRDNRRIKNLLEAELLFIGQMLENKSTFNSDDIIIINKRFKNVCKELNKIDKNITETKLMITGEVSVNETLKELGLDRNAISSNKIRQILYELIENLISTSDDFYFQVVNTICLIGGLSDIYIKNINTSSSNVNFKEVESKYE